MSAQTLKQLSIKTNVVKRLSKELTSDITESEDRQNDLRKMKESGADGADIRNSERVLKDAEMMIPRTEASLKKAVEELDDLVYALKSDDEVKNSADFKTATEVLAEQGAAKEGVSV